MSMPSGTMPINKRELDNGITLISEPVAATKAAAIGFWFYTGSRDESPELSGITHFIEHMLFKGTDSLTARDIARFFDRTGGYVNAFTERENVCLYCVVPGTSAAAAVSVMVDMLARSAFHEADIETERSVIESEILSYLDDPEETCAEWFMETSFGNTGLAQPIAGTVKSVSRISAEEIRNYHGRFFAPRLSCVTASGAINIEDMVWEVSKYPFQSVGFSEKSGYPESALWLPGKRAKKSAFFQTQLVLGWRIPKVQTEEAWFAWSAINDILSDTVSSRLFQEIREERGLCYSIAGNVAAFRDTAFLGINLSVPPEKTIEAVEALEYFTRSFFSDGPAEREIEDARNHAHGAVLLASEDMEYRMKRLAQQFFRDGVIREQEEDLAIIDDLSTQGLNDWLRAIDYAADRSLCMLAPGKYAKLFLRRT